mgnify:CR=1 FL=1
MSKKKKTPYYQFQLRAREGGKCEKCGLFSEKLSVDHIFPQSLLTKWGLVDEIYNDEDNYWLICRPCNILKSDAFDFHHPNTISLIERYINKIKEIYGRRETL